MLKNVIATVVICVLGMAADAYGQGTWSTASLAQPRAEMAATSVGGLSFFAGGLAPDPLTGVGVATSMVDIFNSSTGQWSSATLSQQRYSIAAASVGGYALFAGGTQPTPMGLPPQVSTVDIFNSGTGQWSTASLSSARLAAATSVGNYALFGGGYGLHVGTVDTVDIFNAGNGQWSTAVLGQARQGLCATSVGNCAIFAGGAYWGAYGPGVAQFGSNQVDIFNSTTGQWSTGCLSQARCGVAAASVSSYAIFAGGEVLDPSFQGMSNVVDIFNSITGTWTTASLSMPRENMAATTVGNYAVFAGGTITDDLGRTVASNIVDIFNVSTGLWSTASVSESASGMAATSVGESALFAWGCGDGPWFSDRVDILTIPEPATLSLLALGGAAIMGWRKASRRRRAAAVTQRA